MRRVHGRWRFLANVGDATELPCSVAPRAVRDDLHLLRYASGHRCIG